VPKVRVAIEMDYVFERATYEYVLDENGEEVELNEEQRRALTETQMLEYDKRALVAGDTGMNELLSWGTYNVSDDVTLEVI
jgi:hypothetical protein